MVFSSYLFLFYFLPAALLLYYASPPRGRHLILTIVSYIFYGWANPLFTPLLFLSTAIDYVAGGVIARARGTRRARAALLVSLCSNLALLGFFKYFNFGVDNFTALVEWLNLPALGLDCRAARHPAARDQLLHLPVDELHDRRVSRRGRTGTTASSTSRASSRCSRSSSPDRSSGTPTSPSSFGSARTPLRSSRHGLAFSGDRSVEESPDREPMREGRRPRVRGGLARAARGLVRRCRLRVPDLLRLQRLLGHGDRSRPDDGIQVHEELRLAVPGAVDHRVLAPVAHLALDLAARLPLRAARRQSQGARNARM